MMSFSLHKYYVSITEAGYNGKTGTFELSIKFIGHDLEKALAEAGAPELYIGTEKEIDNADEIILNYIEKRFQFIVNGDELEWKLIGKEVNNDDFVYCYIESNKALMVKEITIQNTLLTEVFPDQENTVYLSINGYKETFNFNKGNTTETFNFN